MKIRIALSLVASLLAYGAFAADLTDAQRSAIEERIAPVGEVCLEGDNSCGGAATSASSGPRSGEEVYNTVCMACHSTGAGGAPKRGDNAAWADRIAKGNDVLHNSALHGVAGTGMIPKGGCMACSDEEVIAAADYIIAGSQ